jgi:hypothetical protein
MKKIFKKGIRKIHTLQSAKLAIEQDPEAVKITNSSLAEDRRKVIGSAKKFIYPLAHAKSRLVAISTILSLLLVVTVTVFTVLGLYTQKRTGSYYYRVVKLIPFPAARVSGRWVSMEDYLFEVRHYLHYYSNKQKLDVESASGREQVADYKKKSLKKVVETAMIKEIATANNIKVEADEINRYVEFNENKQITKGSYSAFSNVLKDYFDWDIEDFKRSISVELLRKKVSLNQDSSAQDQLQKLNTDLSTGMTFADAATKYSKDAASLANGGVFGEFLSTDKTQSVDVSTILVNATAGTVYDAHIMDWLDGYALEIVKVAEIKSDGKVVLAHIVIPITDIEANLNDKLDKSPAKYYLDLN